MTALSIDNRALARVALRRFAAAELTPAELRVENERWAQELTRLRGDLKRRDFSEWSEEQVAGGIAYAEHRLEETTRLLNRSTRQAIADDRSLAADFAAIRYVDLVGLAETLTGQHAVKRGHNFLLTCPFHTDSKPSLTIYPPGRGWGCFVCGKFVSDAASFCAEFFDCTQVEGLRWVEQLCDVPGGR